MTPPRPPRRLPLKAKYTGHAKDQMKLRKYEREQISQIFEECHGFARLQDSVLRPGEGPYGDGRMVLQVEQDGLLHRIIFFNEPISDCFGNPLEPVAAFIHTVIFKGFADPLPGCHVVKLDGSYELPDRDWENEDV
jgi:hypothetical protein